MIVAPLNFRGACGGSIFDLGEVLFDINHPDSQIVLCDFRHPVELLVHGDEVDYVSRTIGPEVVRTTGL